jgi:type IV pilus assembly protein PilY1
MKMSSRVSRSLVVSAGTFWLALAAGHASAAQLNLPTNPLFVSNEVAPNIMLMIDSSGSMTNVVADFPYDPNTTYLALSACPAANRGTEQCSGQPQHQNQ